MTARGLRFVRLLAACVALLLGVVSTSPARATDAVVMVAAARAASVAETPAALSRSDRPAVARGHRTVRARGAVRAHPAAAPIPQYASPLAPHVRESGARRDPNDTPLYLKNRRLLR